MPPRNYRKYTEEQLRAAVRDTFSIRQTLLLLGLKPYGGNYETVHRRIKLLDIDTSHWRGQGWRKGSTRPIQPAMSNEKVFVKGRLFNSMFRRRLIKDGLVPYVCGKCGTEPLWQDEPLSLHVDHMDGDRWNNELSNLRFLCPNCHSQTHTYCRKK